MNESTSFHRIGKVIAHIDRHHERQPDLGELARVAGLSVFHFSREFRRWAGLSPTRYLRTLSLSAAKRELDERGSVLAAAWAAGLSVQGRRGRACVAIRLCRLSVRPRAGGLFGARPRVSRLRGRR
jgi:AraC-like DNA-binding protein